MQVDDGDWSREGDFTEALVEVLRTLPEIGFLRVADSPASRTESGYALLSNEVFVGFEPRETVETTRWLGLLPWRRRQQVPSLDLAGLEVRLAAVEHIGPADYADDGMLQYLKTQRIVPPYQTRGVKLVEMVRVYTVGVVARR